MKKVLLQTEVRLRVLDDVSCGAGYQGRSLKGGTLGDPSRTLHEGYEGSEGSEG